ncbi:hypothetical protein VTL71DRAFT_3082, partial [Oculimacula yallundae]
MPMKGKPFTLVGPTCQELSPPLLLGCSIANVTIILAADDRPDKSRNNATHSSLIMTLFFQPQRLTGTRGQPHLESGPGTGSRGLCWS